MIEPFVPLILALAATVVVAWVGSRLRPRHGAWLTSAAIGSMFVTVMITSWAVTLGFLAHEPLTGDLFAWCRRRLGVHHILSRWVGIPALLIALWSSARAWHVSRSWRRQRGSDASAVHIVAIEHPVAYAQTGRGGGVVVSTGMLAALEPGERRALLAHEQAHLRHRHDRFLVIGELAAGLPPLAPAARQLRLAVERWADEDAARAVGDRTIVARAIARAALVTHDHPEPVLGMLGADVPARVEALLGSPPPQPAATAWASFAAIAVLTALIAATVQLHHLAAVFAAICPG